MKAWISAFRLRTLPLALSCIGMGSFIAAASQAFRWDIFGLCALTTVLLQILSNLANDYGDSIHGADHSDRIGPTRAVQSGQISALSMRNALYVFVALCLASGVTLLVVAFGMNVKAIAFFLGLGLLSIVAAVAYTVGKKPYGYVGLGDVSVLIFFGIVGVLGSQYLFTQSFSWLMVLPALSCGLFATAVLNINNIRDIESDRKAGKYSLPVRIGRDKAVVYHWLLLMVGFGLAVVFTVLTHQAWSQWLFVAVVPLLIRNGLAISRKQGRELDPYLKQMALSTLLFVALFGVGMLIR
ncbi:MAG: 1,4-dihydroxy-2-naphthoate polyprenyltransferase [Cyclobacteriaceae bacterium]